MTVEETTSDTGERLRRTERILQIGRDLTSTVSLERLLHKIVDAAVELTDCEAAGILLLDEHAGGLRFVVVSMLVDQLADVLVPVEGSIAGAAFSSGEPVIVPDVRADPRYYPVVEQLVGLEARSLLAVPLQFKDRRIGVLEVENKRGDGGFGREDVETLTALAAQAAVAIENAHLVEALQESREALVHQVRERTAELSAANLVLRQQVTERERAEEALQRRNQELAALLDAAKGLSTTLRLDTLFERALDELRRVLPYDTALISMLRDERWWVVASRGRERASPQRFDLMDLPLVHRVVKERGPVVVPDVRQEPDWLPVEGSESIRSWFGVPLVTEDEIGGVLMVSSYQPHTYDEGTARLVSAFAHQMALAIENSRLYEQVRMRLREVNLLHSVTMALASTLDMDQMLPYVARSLGEILGGTSVEIYGLGEEANVFTLVASYVAPAGAEGEQCYDLGRAYPLADRLATLRALGQRRPMQVRADDPEADPHLWAELEARGAQAMLLLPMVIGDRVLGFSQVWDSHAARHFTEGEIATGEMLVHQATITVDNARLVEALRQRTVELQARNEELDAFAHTVAHDLKTPLTSLILLSSFLEKRFDQMSGETLQDNLHMVTQSARQMGNIISELLLLASVRKMDEVEMERLDMVSIVARARGRLADMIENNQAEIIVPDDYPAAVGRGPWVEEVWVNYMSNAIKYGGRPPRVELGAAEQGDGTVRFWVRDNGSGLAMEEQARLFAPFTRLGQVDVEGHGLGLSIVRRIVEKMGGQVGVESQGVPGQGSTFFFTLPGARR
jgi:GAF domain-containing protein